MNNERTDPVIAYRVWDMCGDTHLHAIYQETEWPTRKRFEATCFGYTVHIEDTPLSNCECGIYGFKSVELTQDHLYGYTWMVGTKGAKVAGRVALWGTIIECERGYRAQYAYPQMLFYNEQNQERVRKIANAYGVDTAPLPDTLQPPPPREELPGRVSLKNMYAQAMQQMLNHSYGQVVQQIQTYPKMDLTTWQWYTDQVKQQLEPFVLNLTIKSNPSPNDSAKGFASKTQTHPFKAFLGTDPKRKH